MNDYPKSALSVRQPWAWGLVYGGKPIENRTWRRGNPCLSFRGPFMIHAAAGMTRYDYDKASAFMASIGVVCPPPLDLMRGGIIGRGVVAEIVTESDNPWFMGPKGLVITDIEPVEFIPCAGALGFFDWHKGVHDMGAVSPAKWMLPKAEASRDRSDYDLFGGML